LNDQQLSSDGKNSLQYLVLVLFMILDTYWSLQRKMFSKKASIDVKKSTQKFLDGKRDIPTRFRHLKIVLGEFLSLFLN
jgi:hypothetical protein